MTNKPITWREKHEIRNTWCDQLCHVFNKYYKTGMRTQIRIPLYTAQVLSTFEILDYSEIDFSEPKINLGKNSCRTNNENLIYKCFDELIEQKKFIGDYLTEFRNYFNEADMPF